MSMKLLLASVIASFLVVSFSAGAQAASIAYANPISVGVPNPPPIEIESPLNATYSHSDIQLNFTVKANPNWWTGAYHITGVYYEYDQQTVNLNSSNTPQYSTLLANLTNGVHTLTAYAAANGLYYPTSNSSDKETYSIVSKQTVTFTVDAEPTSVSPSPDPTTPALVASLSESASALNFGNKINFTVTVDGGKAPYSYAWHIDNQLTETSSSPYYATERLAVGSHHAYVEVTDSDNSSATTLTVEFNVLSTPSSTVSPSASPSQAPTSEASPTASTTASIAPIVDSPIWFTPNNVIMLVAVLVAIAAVLSLFLYFRKRR